MKVLLSWLKEYIELPETAEEIAKLLTNAGIEVDGIESITPSFQGVIAAKVVKASKHPQADKLTLAEVFDGTKQISLVCGAKNCREGITVALAQVGATLYPDGVDKPVFEVAKATIRGVESSGMLCSEKELGLSDKHEEIIELQGVQVGEALEKKFADVVLEVSLTPNLGHAMSILGIARELSAVTGRPLKKQVWQENSSFAPQSDRLKITLDTKDCPRYSALVIKSVQVLPSSLDVRLKLERSGIRAVNNLVDITNLISHEIGQPLHAFDFARIQESHIIVRAAKSKETAQLLDGTKKELPQGAVVIADTAKVCAVGGVIGEETSAVAADTKEIVLESAYFLPKAVRLARKALGVHTDSAKRFERGCDPRITISALRYAAELVKKMLPEAILESIHDIVQTEFLDRIITCRRSRASQVLGYEVSASDMEMCFVRSSFQAAFDGADLFTVHVPPYRHDITEEIDLIEEVSRLLGQREKLQGAGAYIGSMRPHNSLFLFQRNVRSRLLAENLQEFLTCDLISPKMVEIVKNHPIDQASLVKVMNPMSEEQSILRPSTLPGLLDVVRRNICQRILDVAGFEIGNVHFKKKDKYQERLVFGIVLSGEVTPPHFDAQKKEADFFDLKGIIENLLHTLAIPEVAFKESSVSIFHPGRQAKVMVKKGEEAELQIGMVGELHPSILRQFDISQRVLFAEFDIQDLLEIKKKATKFEPLFEFPSSARDWTVTLPEAVSYEEILSCITACASPILESVSLVVIFRHEKIGKDRKNVTLHFVFRDKEKTVSQAEVDQEHARITQETLKALGKKYPEIAV